MRFFPFFYRVFFFFLHRLAGGGERWWLTLLGVGLICRSLFVCVCVIGGRGVAHLWAVLHWRRPFFLRYSFFMPRDEWRRQSERRRIAHRPVDGSNGRNFFFFLLPFFFPYFFDGLRAGSRFPWPNREIDRLHRAQLPINGDVEVKSRGSFSKRIGATGRQLHRLSAVALLFDMQTRWMDRVSVTFAIETTP